MVKLRGKDVKVPTAIYSYSDGSGELVDVGDYAVMSRKYVDLRLYFKRMGKEHTANTLFLIALPNSQEFIDALLSSNKHVTSLHQQSMNLKGNVLIYSV